MFSVPAESKNQTFQEIVFMKFERLHYLKSILYREPAFILKYYLHKKAENISVDYVYMADGKMIHGGLFDRLKGMASIYALSMVQGKKFGIYFKEPFLLEKYLVPRSYDWRVSESDMIYSYPQSRPIIAYSEHDQPKRVIRKRDGQIHFYYGSNILDYINKQYETEYEWTALFNELFKPSPYLEEQIYKIRERQENKYIAFHLRFLNLLGDKVEKLAYPEMDADRKEHLINDCIDKIKVLSRANNDCKIFVCSDSMIFIDRIKDQMPEVMIVKGNPKHLDNVAVISDADSLKLFLDIYMLVGAEKVFSIVGKGLYSSAFPDYAAKIGGCPFARVSL